MRGEDGAPSRGWGGSHCGAGWALLRKVFGTGIEQLLQGGCPLSEKLQEAQGEHCFSRAMAGDRERGMRMEPSSTLGNRRLEADHSAPGGGLRPTFLWLPKYPACFEFMCLAPDLVRGDLGHCTGLEA